MLGRRKAIMRRRKSEDEGQGEGAEIEQSQIEQAELEETEVQQEEVQESSLAKVDIVTSEKKVTMSAPVKEYEDLKNSLKSMIAAFANFMEATGLEIGKDETITTINALRLELNQMRTDLQSEQAKIRDELVSRSEFEEFKVNSTAEEAKRREESVPRSEFEELKAATEERAAKASEDYVTRGEFEKFRAAVREVI
jgi:hypothetical protein